MPLKLNDIESAFKMKADQGLKVLDDIVDKTDAADKQLNKLSDTTDKIGLGLAALGASITAVFAFAIKGAQAEEESLAQLAGTVNSTGASFEAQRPRIESFINGLTKVTKFSDDELRPALNRAILATNDVDKGMRAVELGAKIAAAGFGNIEGNAILVARLFEGQVAAIGRLIPEFRDLDERLEAGASQADIAAEALARLNTIASNAPAPSAVIQLTKAIGELSDAIGKTANETLTPFVVKVTAAFEAMNKFADSSGGKLLTNIALFGGFVLTAAGSFLLLLKPLIEAGTFFAAFATKVGLATKALGVLRFLFVGAGGIIPAVIAAGIAITALSVILDKLSKASDDARDEAFGSKMTANVSKFRAEMNALQSAINGLDKGTLDAADALEVFNRFGVENRIDAERRVRALREIVAGLENQKKAQDEAAKSDEARAKADAEGKRIAALIAKMEEEKQKRIELEIQAEKFAEAELERGKKLAARVVPIPPPAPPSEGFPGAGLAALTAPGTDPDTGIGSILESTDVAIEKFGTLEERVTAIVEKSRGFEALDVVLKKIADGAEAVNGKFAELDEALTNIAAGGLEQLASLGGNLFAQLATGADEASINVGRFFANLGRQLTAAIARALILQSIIGAVGGPGSGLGKILHGMFQDARADQLARFEGQRFVDLFFQGVTREFGNAQNRIDSSVTENRNLVENRGAPTSVIVTEATPETTVEFTDRKIEPRVRERARQRTGDITNPFGQRA